MTDTKPADEIRFGRVKATIWMNTTEGRTSALQRRLLAHLPRG